MGFKKGTSHCSRAFILSALITAALFVGATLSPAKSGEKGTQGDLAHEKIIGLTFRGRHKAYPLKYFSSAPIVNDLLVQQEVAVFHDPASGLSAAYFRMVLGEPIEFSEKVRRGVAEDLTTITRWDMASGKAVAGNLIGMELIPLRITATSWEEWLASHPDTLVYSPAGPRDSATPW